MARTVTTVLKLKDEMTDKFKKISSSSDKCSKQVQRKFTLMGKKISKTGQKIQNFGNKLTTGLTLPLVGVGTVAVDKFAEVDKTMSLVNATMGNSSKEAETLNAAMKEAAANSTFGMSDAAEASLNFARAGLDAEQAAAALAPAMNLAAGEGGSLEAVSAGLVGTINGFAGSFDDTAHYADVFAAACNNSALDVDSLADSMGVAAPVFHTAGRDVEDAALALGVMANANIDAGTASNALKTGLMRLADEGGSVQKSMEQYGIAASDIWGENGQLKSMSEVQKNLHDSFADLDNEQQLAAASAIFGKNQGAAWLALINSAPGDVDALSQSISNCQGTTDEMSDAMMSGFGGSMEKLKSSVDVLATSLGETLAPYIQKAVDFVQQLTDKFNSLSPEQQDTIVKIGLIVAAIGPAIAIIGSIISTIGTVISVVGTVIGWISSLIGVITTVIDIVTAVAGVIAGVVSGPILLVIAAIAAVIAIVVIFRKQIWEAIQAVVGKIQEFVSIVKAKFEEFKAAIVEKVDAVKEKFQAFKDKVTEIWDGISSAISGAIKPVLDWITDKIDAVKNGFSAVKDVIDKVNPFSSGKNANGTSYWKGGTTWVGEHGPELVDLPSGSKVYPHTKSMNMSGSAAPIVNVTIQGNVIGNDEFATAVGNKVASNLIVAMAN